MYDDRRAAGRALAHELYGYGGPEACVVGLAAGGVPVACEVARALRSPVDVLHVARFRLPEHPEIALGAVAAGGVRVVNEEALSVWGLDPREVDALAATAATDVRRREARHREHHPAVPLAGRDVLLVDDGVATGASMRAAIERMRRLYAGRVIVAVPVAARDSCSHLAGEADEFLCPHCADEFAAVAEWYEHYEPVTDEEIRRCLSDTELWPSGYRAE